MRGPAASCRARRPRPTCSSRGAWSMVLPADEPHLGRVDEVRARRIERALQVHGSTPAEYGHLRRDGSDTCSGPKHRQRLGNAVCRLQRPVDVPGHVREDVVEGRADPAHHSRRTPNATRKTPRAATLGGEMRRRKRVRGAIAGTKAGRILGTPAPRVVGACGPALALRSIHEIPSHRRAASAGLPPCPGDPLPGLRGFDHAGPPATAGKANSDGASPQDSGTAADSGNAADSGAPTDSEAVRTRRWPDSPWELDCGAERACPQAASARSTSGRRAGTTGAR